MISRIFFAVIGLLFAAYIVRTTTRNKIIERESLIWLFFVVVVIFMGVFPGVLDWAAAKLDIAYGPSLLFLLSTLMLAILLLRQTMVMAKHQRRIDELAHRIALLEEEMGRDKGKNAQE